MSNKEFRIDNGYELVEENYKSEPETFVIGDLHLNHANIVTYCDRPFDNVSEMNRVLIKNWNLTVKKTDHVFFLGDMAMRDSDKMADSLNGQIIFIRGNHDRTRDPTTMREKLYSNCKGIEFRFIHNPDRLNGEKFDGWTIHGHHHNNHPDKYPFFDRKKRRFNVSVENIRYRPYPMSELIELINSDVDKIVAL
jgi:calcineurin-like phosphoesterase family protein